MDIRPIEKLITLPESWDHALHTGILFDLNLSSQNLIIFQLTVVSDDVTFIRFILKMSKFYTLNFYTRV